MNNNVEQQTATAGSARIFDHIVSSLLPTRHGEFRIHVYQPAGETVEHVAIVKGDLRRVADCRKIVEPLRDAWREAAASLAAAPA